WREHRLCHQAVLIVALICAHCVSSVVRSCGRADRKPDVQLDHPSPDVGASRRRRRAMMAAVLAMAAGLTVVGTFLLSHHPGTAAVSRSPGRGASGGPAGRGVGNLRSTGPSGSQGPSASGTWHLAFADDFSGTTLDASRWVRCYDWNQSGCTNATNHELQWYTPEQVNVAHGTATLTAQRTPTRSNTGSIYS